MIGESALKVYDTFVFRIEENDKLTPLFQKFECYFSPKKNITYERYLFNTCMQDSRIFTDFLIDLRNKAKNFKFGTLEESLIRNRVACGINSKASREQLLRDTELTLEKTMNFMRAYETSKTQLKGLKNTIQADSINKHGNRANFNSLKIDRPSKKSCYYCGSQHTTSFCPVYGLKCTACGKLNHFAKVCRSKTNRFNTNRVEQVDQKKVNLNVAELYIQHFAASMECTDDLTTSITVNNKNITFKLDTGAQSNVISYNVYNSIPGRPLKKKKQ
ncbi:uncharacterized protein LOC105848150 [Hydra vulgaris]|uniref:uncharacterized protein LOC105848150 n=1 Tax=Hydra vulgaris TaxID=6087 RepID=UPI00064130AF|nr:uncharacterized protein LOC105848150 [Hydra vulgaris]